MLGAGAVRAQDTTGIRATRVAVFPDCRSDCDLDFMRTEIDYVDWVRDRAVADVHLLVTSQETGAGGSQYTVAFLGQRAFAGRGDTLLYSTQPGMSSDERRTGLTRTMSLGLAQFVAHSAAARDIGISRLKRQSDDAPRAGARDPWNAWVFEIDLNSWLTGERLDRNASGEASLAARRVTEAWKSEFEASMNYNENRTVVQEFDSLGLVTSEDTYTSIQRNWRIEEGLVKSLTGRWSAGAQARLTSNTFRNQRRAFELSSGVEFDVYPYKEATRRKFVFEYAVGADRYDYVDTTLFDKIRETIPFQMLQVCYRTRQPWGDTGFCGEHRNYLNDATKHHTNVDANLNIRLFEGFSVGIGANYSWVHDQLYIRKGQRDLADVLLRRQQLLTSYEYGMNIGLTYTFGSVFNNVVNPRF
jgi:hypothetical protein